MSLEKVLQVCFGLQSEPSKFLSKVFWDHLNSTLLFRLNDMLGAVGVPEASINDIINSLKADDLLQACNSHKLKTDKHRKTVFKNCLNYVELMPICLGHNEADNECFIQYIPIKKIIEALFQCETMCQQHREVTVISR